METKNSDKFARLSQELALLEIPVQRVIAVRACLRALPRVIDSTIIEQDLLELIRALLIATVAARFDVGQLQAVAVTATTHAEIIATRLFRIEADRPRSQIDGLRKAAEAARAVHYIVASVSKSSFLSPAAGNACASILDYETAFEEIDALNNVTAESFLSEYQLFSPAKGRATYKIYLQEFEAEIERTGPRFVFWRKWYQGFLDGTPLDWGLQKEIALIADVDWEKGPEWIAGLIEEIRKKYDRKPLDPEQIKEQAGRLIVQPETTALVTTSVADQIDEAIEQYFAEAKVNQLPEALEPLHRLPPLLRAIAEASKTDERVAELEAQIEEMVATVAALTSALEKAKGKSLGKLAAETAVTTSVKIVTTAFWGGLAAGVNHVFGIVDVGTLLERLSTAAPQLPQILEVPAPTPNPPTNI